MDVFTSKLSEKQRNVVGFWKYLSDRNLFYFIKRFLERPMLVERIHGPICQAIGEPFLWFSEGKHHVDYGQDNPLPDSEEFSPYPRKTRLRDANGLPYKSNMFTVPRKCLKTTIAAEGFPVWALAHDGNLRIMEAALGEDLAISTLGVVDQRIKTLSLFRYAYMRDGLQWEKSDIWNKTSKIIAARTKPDKSPSLGTAGSTSSDTGQHFDIIISDDLIDKRVVNSTELTDSVNVYFGAVPQLLHGPLQLHYVLGTRYGYGDLYSRIEEDMAESWGIYVRSAYNPDGSVWCPEILSEEELDRLRTQLTEQGNADDFASQYLMSPKQPGSSSFNLADIPQHTTEELPKPESRVCIISVDPAGTDIRKQGPWGISALYGDSEENNWVAETVKGSLSGTEAARTTLRMGHRHMARYIIVEETAISNEWIHADLLRMMKEIAKDSDEPEPVVSEGESRAETVEIEEVQEKIYAPKRFRIILVKPGLQDKRGRIETTIDSLVARRKLHILKKHRDLQVEIQRFPSKGTYDLLDSIAQGAKIMRDRKLFPAPGESQIQKPVDFVARYYEDKIAESERLDRIRQATEYRKMVHGMRRRLS